MNKKQQIKDSEDSDSFSEGQENGKVLNFNAKEWSQFLNNSEHNIDQQLLDDELNLNQFQDVQIDNSFADGDSLIDELANTQNNNTRDIDELDETIRKLINSVLHSGIDSFSLKLFTNIQVKTTELTKLTSFLKSFRILREHFKKESVPNFEKNERNVRGRKIQVEDHQRSGLPIKFQVCDKAINPFVMSFNQTLILILNDEPSASSQILDAFDSYLRDQNQIIYIVAERVRDEIQSLSIKFLNGQCTFVIKCGIQENSIDHLQYAMLKTYVAISEPFQVVTAFLLHWADQRGILGDQMISEFALQCMIIDFFQINDMLPLIFDSKFCFWPKEKKMQMESFKREKIKQIDHELLQKQFSPNEYTIVYQQGIKSNQNYKRDVFVKVHFHTFPREDSVNLIKEVQAKQAGSKGSKRDHNVNYGVIVAKFFFSYAIGSIQKRKIDITGVQPSPSEQDIGYQVMSPMVPGLCLTRSLARRSRRDGQSFLPKAYRAVKDEFERAYTLLSQGKFKEISQERTTFIQN